MNVWLHGKIVNATSRQRGRPRTNANIEESQDRRRKQLRSAQQTYRKRKDKTIDTLRSRVYQLEDGVEQIGHSFLAFSSLLLKMDIAKRDSRVTLSLRELVQQCLALAKTCDELEERAHLNPALTKNAMGRNSMQSDDCVKALEIDGNTATRHQSPMKQSKTQLLNEQQSLSPFQSTCSFNTAMATTISHSYAAIPCSPDPMPSSVCCQSGYQLLVNAPNNRKVQEIFGTFLSSTERNAFISAFCQGLQDQNGDLVNQMATVLAPLQLRGSNYTSEELTAFYAGSNSAAMMQLDGLMDANDVQDMLFKRGFYIKEFAPSLSRSSLNSTLDVATFAECELLVTRNTWKFTNIGMNDKVLAIRCICIGSGPVFKRRNVERSLRLAMCDDPIQVVSDSFLPDLDGI
ncbi:hypothetical protein N7481_007026 [Penicillium waksmanii]|uniref:uncharacterized protein n=1 Tax=Penicillium waksmanii TaxID=69791 RepID=UPI0025484EA1|nr:uncharacterized protein N7481_007026 [Penicillium waksmanii]KAJ5979728.1 hypothetical protein N7481_007026 [Penicillium waksmanii]